MVKITVKINKNGGAAVVEAHGIKGTGCDALLNALTRELGTIVEDTPTAEYYEAEPGEMVLESGGW